MFALIEQLDQLIALEILEDSSGRPPDIGELADTWETDDYPSGRHRVKAKWYVEVKGKKSRVARQTESTRSPGVWMSPKKTTYGYNSKIGVGRDGKTYIVQATESGGLEVRDGTMGTVGYYKPKSSDHDPGDDLANRMGLIKVVSQYEGGELPDSYMYLPRKAGKAPHSGRGIEVIMVMMRKRQAPKPEPEKPLPANASKMPGPVFVDAIKNGVKKGYVKGSSLNQYTGGHYGAMVTYFNLPRNHERHNVNPTNNAFSFTISGFGKGETDPPPKGKVKIEMTRNSYRVSRFRGDEKQQIKNLRAKTGPPEKIVDYLLKYIAEIGEIEPALQ